MKRTLRIYALLLAAVLGSACVAGNEPYPTRRDRSGESGRQQGPVHQTAFFMASDRHDNGKGNNLAAMLRLAVKGSEVTPSAVLLDGDLVGGGRNRTPEFSVISIYNEIDSVLNTHTCEVLLGYGSHDAKCAEGYASFLSGPRRMDGYFVYGISFAQMKFPTDSAAAKLDRRGRKYSGLDTLDRRGLSAESGSRSFSEWVSTVPSGYPVVVMSHMPLHALRKDNLGAQTWLAALNEAGREHDIFFLWAHNHTTEERAVRDGKEPLDRYSYLLVPGDSIQVQTPVDSVSTREPVRFTYVNAGYLESGYASVVTFTDSRGIGRYDRVRIERFSLREGDSLNVTFGNTGRPNPYGAWLRRERR